MAELVQVPKIQIVAARIDDADVNLYGFISEDGEVLNIHDDDGKVCSMDVSNFMEFAMVGEGDCG